MASAAQAPVVRVPRIPNRLAYAVSSGFQFDPGLGNLGCGDNKDCTCCATAGRTNFLSGVGPAPLSQNGSFPVMGLCDAPPKPVSKTCSLWMIAAAGLAVGIISRLIRSRHES
jgi:hypothetical protein